MWRELLLLRRSKFLYTFRTGQVCFLALVTSFLFFRTTWTHDLEGGQLVLSVLFFTLLHMLFNGFSEMTLLINNLPVFYKHRDILFYSGVTYALPGTLALLPFSMLEGFTWTIVLYWVVGLAPDAGRFFLFMLLCMLTHTMAVALFRAIGAVGRNLTVANTFGSFFLALVFLTSGITLSPDQIPGWYIWAYWASPLNYAQRALSTNELTDAVWSTTLAATGAPVGDTVLAARGLPTSRVWVWVGLGALAAFWLLFTAVTALCLSLLSPWHSGSPTVPQEALDALELKRSGLVPVRGGKHTSRHGSMQDTNGSMQDTNGSVLAVDERRLPSVHALSDMEAGHPPHRAAMGIATSEPVDRDAPSVLPFTPMTFAFQDISYWVPLPPDQAPPGTKQQPELQLLCGISGVFSPGVLACLMGESGAGKTTLLDVLANRKTTGRVRGAVRVNGHALSPATFARVCGYVEQSDIHSPGLTVHESLVFSARLRLPRDVPTGRVLQHANEVEALMELDTVGGAIVGAPGTSGLSVEQRKRLTIAVELVANPAVVFMGTIHQPSQGIFETFDELLLLKRGGVTIYNGPLGPHASILIANLQSMSPKPGTNPASWMLEVTSPVAEAQHGLDVAAWYSHSDMKRVVDKAVADAMQPAPNSQPLHFSSVHAQPAWTQFQLLLWRNTLLYWRSPQYNVIRLGFTAVIGFIFGTLYWDIGTTRGTYIDVLNVMGALYGAVLFLGVNNASSVQPIVGAERPVFYRERAAGLYSALPFAVAQALVEVPYVLAQTVIYSLLVYFLIRFEISAAKFWWFFLYSLVTFVLWTLYGMAAVAISPSVQLAAVLSSFFYSLWNLFSGFLITRPQMPPWLSWYYYLNPVSWSLAGLITTQLGDVDELLETPTGALVPVSQYVADTFAFEDSYQYLAVIILLGFVAAFAVVLIGSLRFFNWQKR